MDKVIWDKKYNLGHSIIDGQHQYLVSLMNLIIENKENLSQEEIKLIFKKLLYYANIHFHDEEVLIADTDYPYKLEHKLEHKYFIEKLEILEKDILLGDKKVIKSIIIFLYEWLINHIQISDKDFSLYLDDEVS